MTGYQHLLTIGLAAALAACDSGQPDRPAAGAEDGARTDMDSAGGMGGMTETDSGMAMPGMNGQMGGMMSGGMMDDMQQHMQRMMGAGADSMQSMMPMHRQMTANMLLMMNREMQEMNMTADTGWSATMDSVRRDLVRMPEMGSWELRELMPTHRDRVMRLMEMHQSMMGGR